MKVGPTPDVALSSQDFSAKEKTRGAPVRSAAPAQTDQVSLSAAGSQISGSKSSSMDFDSAKVDAIKEAIRRGEFKVDSGVIADRLIAEASALLQPRPH